MNRKLVIIISYATALFLVAAGLINIFSPRTKLGGVLFLFALLQFITGFINVKLNKKEKREEEKEEEK